MNNGRNCKLKHQYCATEIQKKLDIQSDWKRYRQRPSDGGVSDTKRQRAERRKSYWRIWRTKDEDKEVQDEEVESTRVQTTEHTNTDEINTEINIKMELTKEMVLRRKIWAKEKGERWLREQGERIIGGEA